MRITHVLLVIGAGAASAAVALGCEGDSGGSSSGAFIAPDSSFSSDTSTGSSGSSGGVTDGGEDGDAAIIDEPTTPVALINMPSGIMQGAASSNGSAIVISVVGPVINFSIYEPATGWTAGAPIPSVTTTSTIRGNGGAVAMDGKGNAFVAWTTTTPDNHNGFYVARYDHTTRTWGPALQPDPYAENFGDPVAVTANDSGDALASAIHKGATLDANFVVQHYSASSGTWSSELVQSFANDTNVDLPELHLADSGKAVALVYPRTVGVRTAAGTWTLSPDYSATCGASSAAINEAGDVLVAGEITNYACASRYDAATATWTPPASLSTAFTFTGGCNVAAGIQPNGDGVYVRCFDLNDGSRRNMESYTFKKATAVWSTVALIDDVGQGPGETTWAFDKAGNGFALYEDFATLINAVPAPLFMNTFTASTGTWSKQSAALGGVIDRTYAPTGFLSPNGRGFAVWAEGASLHAKKIR